MSVLLQLLGLAGLSLCALACARTPQVPPGQKGEPGMSPGPRGLLSGTDYRVPLTWLETPEDNGPGDFGRWLEHGGRERYYELHVPPGYVSGTPMPLVLNLHGGAGFAAMMRGLSGMDEVADREGFLVVYPAGTSARFTDRFLFWNTGRPMRDKQQESVDDVDFIATVLDDVARFFTVDARRVYATGISNGAAMAYRLAAELPDRIAAIAPVAGQMAVGEFGKRLGKPVGVLHFAGMLDPHNPYEGGSSETVQGAFEDYDLEPVPEVIDSWARLNGCGEAPTGRPTERRVGQARFTSFGRGEGGAEVALWVLEDGGHTWPGGTVSRFSENRGSGPVSSSIRATDEMWAFFERHALPATEPPSE